MKAKARKKNVRKKVSAINNGARLLSQIISRHIQTGFEWSWRIYGSDCSVVSHTTCDQGAFYAVFFPPLHQFLLLANLTNIKVKIEQITVREISWNCDIVYDMCKVMNVCKFLNILRIWINITWAIEII